MSSVAKTQSSFRRHFDLRSYFAGGVATTALIGAAIVLFGALAAYVAFNGLPVGGAGDPPGTQVVVGAGSRAPEAAAAALARAPAAVAAAPVARAGGGSGPAAPAADASSPAAGTGVGSDGTQPATSTGTAPVTPQGAQSAGGSGQTINELGNATNLPLGDLGPVDEAIGQGLNQVGGVVGNPQLGDQINGAVGELSQDVPGGG